MLTIVPYSMFGIRQRTAFKSNCYGEGAIEHPTTYDYELGYLPPRYPVPAIVQWYEWCYQRGAYLPGQDLFDESVALVHCELGPY